MSYPSETTVVLTVDEYEAICRDLKNMEERVRVAEVRAGKRSWLACEDCGLPYSDDGWLDAVVPDDVWRQISPTGHEGGILCISCMARRCLRLGIATRVTLGSGPFVQEAWSPGILRRVAEQLEADANSSRPYGTRQMAVKTLDAYAAAIREALGDTAR